ncbi:MAG TPA: aldehyde dehydrogenase family protein [Bacteroidetes bacterium]|nr:aldehyde dehydrogenase family protein [Bacteroidota bacterium]
MNQYQDLLNRQRKYFWANLKTSTAQDRIKKLRNMKKWVLAHQEELKAAIYADFKKPAHEVDLTELLPVVSELKDAIANLQEWMRERRVPTPISMLGTSSKVTFEPKGNTLILAPWNFPFMLTIGPLISAVAAGCTAIIKPSEYSENTSNFIAKMLEELFSEEEVACLRGDHTLAQALTALPFDHIFFTGSPEIGKKVMHAAAEHLCSVTLELGGRNPVIVDETASISDTTRKLIWGKFMNAGQSCMSPNYIQVQEKIYSKLLEGLKTRFETTFKSHQDNIQESPDLSHVINARHFQRLSGLIEKAKAAGAKVLIGGHDDPETNFLAPTILYDVEPGNPILEEEIFGPIVPILKYKNLDDALGLIRSMEKPLGLYIFSRSRRNIAKVIRESSSGNVMVNETTIAFGHPELPFGGVNHSGIGKAHGHAGFLAFTNEKPVVKQSTLLPSTLLAHAPYTKWKSRILNFVIRWF